MTKKEILNRLDWIVDEVSIIFTKTEVLANELDALIEDLEGPNEDQEPD